MIALKLGLVKEREDLEDLTLSRNAERKSADSN